MPPKPYLVAALALLVPVHGCRPATTYDVPPSETEPAGRSRGADAPEETGASGETSDGTAGAPAEGGDVSDASCAAPAARVAELADGSARDGTRVELSGLVATSYEFLVYRAESTGSCLWGVYASEPDVERSAEGGRRDQAESAAGVLLVSYGEPAPSADADCPLGASALPTDVAPGTELLATGEVGRYAPAACRDAPASVQLRVEPRCPLEALGQGSAPDPVPLTLADADAIARGEPSALAAFGGALVELRSASAQPVSGESDAVAPYGVIRLVETALEVHDALAFMDLRAEGPGDFEKAFEFSYPVEFSRLTGIVHLDYCTWSLAPRDACADFAPPSARCAH